MSAHNYNPNSTRSARLSAQEANVQRAEVAADPANLRALPFSKGAATQVQAAAETARVDLEIAAANLGVTTQKAAQVAELNKNLAALNGEFGLSYLVAKFYITGLTSEHLYQQGIVLYAPDKSPVATGYTDVLIALKRLRELAKKHKAATARREYAQKRQANQSKKGYLTNV